MKRATTWNITTNVHHTLYSYCSAETSVLDIFMSRARELRQMSLYTCAVVMVISFQKQLFKLVDGRAGTEAKCLHYLGRTVEPIPRLKHVNIAHRNVGMFSEDREGGVGRKYS